MRPTLLLLPLAAAALAGCTVPPPSGPTVMALPGQGKSFETFQQDDFTCRGYAMQASGGAAASQAATNQAVTSAVVGTALGAGVGAALGSVGGAVGAGAAIGGATGLLAGSAVGANQAQYAGASAQQRYDIAYTQCMYARGDSVQSAPSGYVAYAAPYPVTAYPYPYGYAYPYPYPYYGYPGTSVSIGVGGGWGRGWGWHRW